MCGVLGVFALRGALKGFFRGAFGILGLGVGVAAALLFWRATGQAVAARWGVGPGLGYVAAFALLFLGPYVGLHLAGGVLERLGRAVHLGGMDRLGGAALGGVTGAVLAGAGLKALTLARWGEELVSRSPVARPLVRALDRVVEWAGR